MKWSVDPPVRVGDCVCAAVVEVEISVRSGLRSLSARGEKRPILFLVERGGAVTGVDVNGHRYDEEEIEVLYPQAIAVLRAG